MNRWQLICPLALLVLVIAFVAHRHAQLHNRALMQAVTDQLDGHAPALGALLVAMGTNDTVAIEDAAYAELQRVPSTSLIARADIRVTRTSNGSIQCVVDTSRWGVSPRTIRQPTSHNTSL